jgi:hypothetical protein
MERLAVIPPAFFYSVFENQFLSQRAVVSTLPYLQ